MSEVRSVLVVEDKDDIRDWLCACVLAAFPGARTTTAANLRDGMQIVERMWNRAVAHGQKSPFDIALVDIGLPDGNGIDLVSAISSRSSETMSIVTTIYEDDEHLFRAIEAGAQGYLLKYHETERLVELLQRINEGEPPLSPSIARRILTVLQKRNQKVVSGSEVALTPREIEVLGLLGRGFQLSQVAAQLNMAQNTASSHVKAIYRKLNISNRAEAAIAAMVRGLVDGQGGSA